MAKHSIHEAVSQQSCADTSLCHCIPGATGHTHGAPVSPEVWAEGVLAIAFLGQYTQSTSAPRLTAKNRRIAKKILKDTTVHKKHD